MVPLNFNMTGIYSFQNGSSKVNNRLSFSVEKLSCELRYKDHNAIKYSSQSCIQHSFSPSYRFSLYTHTHSSLFSCSHLTQAITFLLSHQNRHLTATTSQTIHNNKLTLIESDAPMKKPQACAEMDPATQNSANSTNRSKV